MLWLVWLLIDLLLALGYCLVVLACLWWVCLLRCFSVVVLRWLCDWFCLVIPVRFVVVCVFVVALLVDLCLLTCRFVLVCWYYVGCAVVICVVLVFAVVDWFECDWFSDIGLLLRWLGVVVLVGLGCYLCIGYVCCVCVWISLCLRVGLV